jgi:hypothetical protein
MSHLNLKVYRVLRVLRAPARVNSIITATAAPLRYGRYGLIIDS